MMHGRQARNKWNGDYVSNFEQIAQAGRFPADQWLVKVCSRRIESLADSGVATVVGWRRAEKMSRCCKILKQVADRTNSDSGARDGCEVDQDFAPISASEQRCQIAVSRSEAKFFLDTPQAWAYVERKISSRVCERAKFHLLGERDFLNWRSCLSGGGVSSAQEKTDARLKKAEGRKQGLDESSIATPSLKEDETLGFWRFSADMEEGLIIMNRKQRNQRGRGEGPIDS